MTSERLGEMFKGDSADMCAGKFPLVLMGGRADPSSVRIQGARTPIGASGNLNNGKRSKSGRGPRKQLARPSPTFVHLVTAQLGLFLLDLIAVKSNAKLVEWIGGSHIQKYFSF